MFKLLLGPAIAAVLLLVGPQLGMSDTAWRTAALGIWMGQWWVSEAVPIAATALLPLVFLPLLGVLTMNAAAAPYANPVIYLFFGGFVLAAAFERSGLHRRLALALLGAVGTRPDRIIGGIMVTAALISMWVSNTATVLMVLPLAQSMMSHKTGREQQHASTFEKALLLGVAYAATIGGFGTPIGSPPNALLTGFLAQTHGIRVTFLDYMIIGVPVVAIATPLAWLLLTKVIFKVRSDDVVIDPSALTAERAALGPMSRAEKFVGVVGALTAIAWMAQPAIARLAPAVSEAGISVACALVLLTVPIDARGTRAISWDEAERIPWGVLVLFGGGLSLAAAIQGGGLAEWIGYSVTGLRSVHPFPLVLIVTAVITFLTEFTSNTATAAAFLPIASSLAVGAEMSPLVMSMAAGMAASNGFMMPVGTPPNAIVFASGKLTIPEMAKAGLLIDLLFIILLTLAAYFLATPVLT